VLRLDRDGFSVDSARKKKRKLPDWYLDEPPAPPEADFFYEAFRDLVTERPPDGGAIPWGKAMAYADRKGLAPDVTDVLWTAMRKMDEAERGWQIENLKAGNAGGG
jgi:hypothetical protein